MNNDRPIDNSNIAAFPQDSNNHLACDVGLSKREYFAGIALAAVIQTSSPEDYTAQDLVKGAVRWADLLLLALRPNSDTQ